MHAPREGFQRAAAASAQAHAHEDRARLRQVGHHHARPAGNRDRVPGPAVLVAHGDFDVRAAREFHLRHKARNVFVPGRMKGHAARHAFPLEDFRSAIRLVERIGGEDIQDIARVGEAMGAQAVLPVP